MLNLVVYIVTTGLEKVQLRRKGKQRVMSEIHSGLAGTSGSFKSG
jgi:hypothetical protein